MESATGSAIRVDASSLVSASEYQIEQWVAEEAMKLAKRGVYVPK